MSRQFSPSATQLCVLPVVALLMLGGCSGDSRVGKVQGMVKLDGKPVADAGVSFTPIDGGRSAFGVTAADGSFELTSYEIGDGAQIGNHVVTIMAVDEEVSSKAEELAEEHGSLAEVMSPKAMQPKEKWRVPEPYSDASTSGLEFEVKSGEVNLAEFDLDPNP